MFLKKIFIGFCGLAITVYALYSIAKPFYLMFTGVSAKGIVFAIGKKDGSNSKTTKGLTRYFFEGGRKAKIHFLPSNTNDSITCIANGGLFSTHYSIGEEVTVYYNNKNSLQHSVVNFTQISTYLPILFLGIVIIFVVAKTKRSI